MNRSGGDWPLLESELFPLNSNSAAEMRSLHTMAFCYINMADHDADMDETQRHIKSNHRPDSTSLFSQPNLTNNRHTQPTAEHDHGTLLGSAKHIQTQHADGSHATLCEISSLCKTTGARTRLHADNSGETAAQLSTLLEIFVIPFHELVDSCQRDLWTKTLFQKFLICIMPDMNLGDNPMQ